jgi:ketosteroid isomerase-like protein
MSQENIEIVSGVYDALNSLDWDAAFRDMHPDVEVKFQRAPDAGTLRQREAVQEFLEDYLAAFEQMVFEPEEFHESGDQVVVLVKRRARPKGGSGEMVVQNGHIWTVRDGIILSMRSFPDPKKALEAAGLSE